MQGTESGKTADTIQGRILPEISVPEISIGENHASAITASLRTVIIDPRTLSAD
jgi:hypothetical protein